MKFYLIPYEEPTIQLPFIHPKYFSEIGDGAKGVISQNRADRKFYILLIPDTTNTTSLESHDDVRKLDAANLTRQKLIAIGISGIPPGATQDELEEALCEWLLNERRTLRTL